MEEKTMKKYLFRYQFQGTSWCCDVYANNAEEAKEKIKAMSQATYDGELCEEIPFDEKINFKERFTEHHQQAQG